MPACAVDTNLDLAWEGAFGDLAIDGGPGQTGAGQDGFQADDPVWFGHGHVASCWLFLTAADPEGQARTGAQEGFSRRRISA